jgi:hypothetical protein
MASSLGGLSSSLSAVASAVTANPAAAKAWFTETLPSGTANPDGIAANTWGTRSLNTVEFNEISGASLAANQITLPAGTYEIDASQTVNDTNSSTDARKCRFRNITDGATAIVGMNDYQGAAFNSQFRLQGRFTIAGTKAFALQVYTGNGLAGGVATSTGEAEVYVSVYLRKIA